MKPPFQYMGAKVELSARWASRLPEHRTYVEPFGGSAAMLFAKQPSEREIVSDKWYWLINFHQVVRDDVDGLLARLGSEKKVSRNDWSAAFHRVKNDWRSAPPEDAATFLTYVSGSYAGKVCPTDSWFSIRTAQGVFQTRNRRASFQKAKIDLVCRRIQQCSVRAKGVEFLIEDGCDLIVEHRDDRGALLFIDPPYLSARLGGSRAQSRGYYYSDVSHERIMQSLSGLKGAAMVTIGQGDVWFWEDFFSSEGWLCADTMTYNGRVSNIRASHSVYTKGFDEEASAQLPLSGWDRAALERKNG